MISIVVNFRNEENVIPELIERLIKVVEKIKQDYEIIFIDDCSTDSSRNIIEKKIENNKNFKYLKTTRRVGIAKCTVYGLSRTKGDLIVSIDADLQDPPELIEEMVEYQKTNNVEIVHTQRTKRLGENLIKIALTKFAYYLIAKFSWDKIPDNTGDFKLYTRKALDRILTFDDKDPFVRGLSIVTGLNQGVIKYERHPRSDGKTGQSLISSFDPYEELFRGLTFNSYKLIFLIFIISIIQLFLSALFFIFNKMTFSFIALSSFFIIFCIGIVGIYLKKISNHILKSSQITIEHEIGF